MKDQKFIESLLYDHDVELLHLECDGFTRVAHYTLKSNGIEHQCFAGLVVVENKTMTHWWIKVGNMTIDYRLRRWFPDLDGLPHGVFDATKFKNVQYHGEAVQLNVPHVMYEILTQPVTT